MTEKIELGDKARDKVTGIEGIVSCVHDFLYGVDRVAIHPEGSFEGKAHETVHIDMPQAELVEKNVIEVPPKDKLTTHHGDTVKCKITGFKGLNVGTATWLYGCYKTLVQPEKLAKSGKPSESMWFDTPQLDVVKKAKAKKTKKEKAKIAPRKTTGGHNDNVSTNMYKTS